MFFRLFAIFALLAVAFANPNPKPQLLGYPAGAAYPVGAAYPYGYDGYAAAAYAPYAAPSYPYGYSAYYR